jgi:uncharacterized protein YheU (UPF0270 family)
MIIPWQSLSEDALQGIIEDYVTREGSDYGGQEFTLARKVEQVQAQLQQGRVVIVFDAESESCSILPADELPDLAGRDQSEPELDQSEPDHDH